MKKRDTQWRVAENHGMTDQEVDQLSSQAAGQLLLDGWQAAERDDPLDLLRHPLWIDGYRLRMAVKAAMRAGPAIALAD